VRGSANPAKERLQVMIASKRLANSVQMQAMQKELLAVVDVSSTSHLTLDCNNRWKR